jgi:hypothetical protein
MGSDLLLGQGGHEFATEVGYHSAQTGGAAPYRCPARTVVAPAPYRPTPTATTATADFRVVLDPSGGTEVSRMT